MNMATRSRRPVIIGIILIAIALGGYGLYYRYLKNYYGFKPLPFSREAWMKADADTRGYMVGDLERRYGLVGRSQQEVFDLLGMPDGLSTVDGYSCYSRERRPSKEEVDKLLGKPELGRLAGADYDIGYLGFNPDALGVFSYQLHIYFKNGVVTEEGVDD